MEIKIHFLLFLMLKTNSPKIKKKKIFDNYKYLKKHNLQSIKSAQKQATINVFKAKKFHLEILRFLKKMKKL